MAEKKKTINDKLSAIQTELKVKKTSYNSFGKYYFRNSETILEALKPLLKKHECTLTIKEDLVVVGDTTVMYSVATLTDGENEAFANSVVGIDFDQRGMNMPQKFGSASSYAKKYALGNLFLIDDTADSDATNEHGKGNVSKAVAKVKAAVKPVMTKDQFEKAKEYITAGGDMKAIESKYKINTQHLVELNKING
tara:strand:- start:455 stop:1039 length:585 start_codon:yes stop_codon:yes gene_type:complete